MMRKLSFGKLLSLGVLCVGAFIVERASALDVLTVDAAIKPYQKSEGISGNLNSVGSDTLNNLMTLWAEGFQKVYPNVKIQIEGKGSGTAPPALIAGTAQLGPMSRQMKATELDEFEKKFGYKPMEIKVAVDALAVFVHKDNPITGLTLAQVDAIFSKSRRRGLENDIATWGQLGLTGDWAKRPISLYGRNSASGTYGYFKEKALENGDYKDTVKEQPGSASVVNSVSVDLGGIGYSGVGYKTAGVKAVPLAMEGSQFITASAENSYSGEYPLSRFLYVYLNRNPQKPLDPLTREFVKFILSSGGQQIVLKDGYFSLTAGVASEAMSKLG